MTRSRWFEAYLTPRKSWRNDPVGMTIAAVFTLLWTVLAFHPYDRFDWMLENLLIWLTLPALAVAYRFALLSNWAYTLIALFLLLHAVGAHYSYNQTPVDPLLKTIFGTQRNLYDRVVHFSFGLLWAWPLCELALRLARLRGAWLYAAAAAVIMSCAALYELIEMWVAEIVAPEIGTLFLGTQGDPWDTQHDMEMALYGVLLAIALIALAQWAGRSRSKAKAAGRP